MNEIYKLDVKNVDIPLLLRKYSINDYWKAEKEVNVYRSLKEQGKVPIPEVYLEDRKRDSLPFPYLIISELPGEDLREVYEKADKKTRSLLIERAGECLGKIHQVTYPAFGWLTSSAKNWSEVLKREMGWGIVSNIFETDMPKELVYRTLDYMHENKSLLDIDEEPVLVHNDFTMDNIKIQDNMISGVFDFEFALSGHNEYDFIKPNWFMLDNKKLKERFMTGYKRNSDVSSKFDERIKYYEAQKALGMYIWSYKNKLKDQGQRMLNILKTATGFE